ncbi:MAG TPA: DUF3488 and transglutaminase-like domain-containing protein [Dehalococcoidales bacterium]|nr:DUF3488 and transglutaminase-like domain-containing protein [Dehalococcoidales bacterium]
MRATNYPAIAKVLAFLAVSSSIAAVGWSIQDFSVVAVGIPGLAAGHLYSWRRREASIVRSLILLLFMVLTVFLGEDILRSGLSDRLLLSRYLIYGLVLGSFDLMRKRHVMASVILGALLLVLISELALNPWFLAFVVTFTVLALIAAAISRIEAETGGGVVAVGEISWPDAGKVWLGFAGATVLLAGAFFLLMPRLASTQVTQASWLPSRLDLTLSGLLKLPSKPSASVDSGILPSLQEGESAGAGEYATLGYTGSYADTAVMHVRSQISSYWRGMTLDEYDGRGWLASSGQVQLHNEGRGEFTLPDSQIGLDEGAYWQVYYILSDQPNAVFTGYNPGRIFLPRLEPSLVKGTLYRALSSVPRIRPERLRTDRVTSDDEANLRLPPITERTAVLAESIVEGFVTDYDKAVRLERFLLTKYPYKLDVGPLPPGHDAVDYFLFEQQAGYCANFATAMAVMARHVGLPSRVAAGYLPGLIDPLTGAHIVRVGDAHAWVEIHFQRQGWVAFDPTPRADAAMGFVTRRSWIHFGLEDYTGISAAGVMSPLGRFSFRSLPASAILRGSLIAMAVAVILLALRHILRGRRAKEELVGYSTLEGESRKVTLKLYSRMIAILTKKGLPARLPHQPPGEYAALVSRQIPAAGGDIVTRLTGLAASAAYDPKPFSPPDIREASRSLFTLKKTLARRG